MVYAVRMTRRWPVTINLIHLTKEGGSAYRCEGRRQRRVLHCAKRRCRIQVCDMECYVVLTGMFIHVIHYFNRSFA